jgi:hypothetical protein
MGDGIRITIPSACKLGAQGQIEIHPVKSSQLTYQAQGYYVYTVLGVDS